MELVIIEDELPHFVLMQRAILREFPQARLHHFEDARSCLESLDGLSPQMIICDYLMPGMNGIELLERLTREKLDIPLIMITGQGNEATAVQAMKLGAWEYLVKTPDFFTLLPSVVRKVLREKEMRASLDESARLNTLLLNSLPHPAMLIRPDRTIIAANKTALDLGARIGGYCWRDFAHCQHLSDYHRDVVEAHRGGSMPKGVRCSFCLADQAMETGRPASLPELKMFDRLWDTWWISVDQNVYYHYAIDITERRKSEKALWESREQLKALSTRLLSAQEEERKRIACELHDTVGSSLSAIKMSLENALGHAELGTLSPDMLRTSISWAVSAMDETRRIMTDLRPSILDDLGIAATIRWFCRLFRSTYPSITVIESVEIEESELPIDIKTAIYRILQESCNNVVKYSGAGAIRLTLGKAPGGIELTVEDDGVGFDPSAVRTRRTGPGGLGLTSMQERAELTGGSFEIASAPGQGCRIRAVWPME